MGTQVYSHVYAKAHSIVFLSDSLRNTLREVIRENGLSSPWCKSGFVSKNF